MKKTIEKMSCVHKLKKLFAAALAAVLVIACVDGSLIEAAAEETTYSDDTVALLIKSDGDTKPYTTLAAACQAATDSTDTIKLLKDSSVTVIEEEPGERSDTVYFGGSAGTYDLNGHTVSISGRVEYRRSFNADSTTIKNGTINFDISNVCDYSYSKSYIFEDVTFACKQEKIGSIGDGNAASSITIKGRVSIDGGIDHVSYNKLEICENASLTVNGDLKVFSLWSSDGVQTLVNNGTVSCSGNFIMEYSNWKASFNSTVSNNGTFHAKSITENKSVEGNSISITNSENAIMTIEESVEGNDIAITNSGTLYVSEAVSSGNLITNTSSGKVETLQTIDSVTVTDIEAPQGGKAFDTTGTCSTEGVASISIKWTDTEDNAVGETADFYPWTYNMHVTFTPAAGYVFSENTNIGDAQGQLTYHTRRLNSDGTFEIYGDVESSKAKLLNIQTPKDIKVLIGTSYADIAAALPKNVTIKTEAGTQEVSVQWDTSMPVEGSYDPAKATEQAVTLKGTLSIPDAIAPNNIEPVTKINIKIVSKPYSIIYKDKEGAAFSGSFTGDYPASYGTETQLISPVRAGYGFAGWYTDESCSGEVVTSLAAPEYTGDVTLYAAWESLTEKYQITSGANQTVEQVTDGTQTVTIRCNGEKDNFVRLLVDGKEVDKANYSVVSGSTIITLNSDYLKTLSEGSHTVRFVYNDNGYAETTLTIVKNAADDTDSDSDDDDSSDDDTDNSSAETVTDASGIVPGVTDTTAAADNGAADASTAGDTVTDNNMAADGSTDGAAVSPQTGDSAPMAALLACMVAAFAVIINGKGRRIRK